MNNHTQNSIDDSQLILRKTLDVICGKWRLFVVFQIGNQVRRYGELRAMIPEISEKVLVQELRSLIELGVVEKRSFSEVPPRVEYKLTPKGLRVLPSLLKLTSIGEAFLEP